MLWHTTSEYKIEIVCARAWSRLSSRVRIFAAVKFHVGACKSLLSIETCVGNEAAETVTLKSRLAYRGPSSSHARGIKVLL